MSESFWRKIRVALATGPIHSETLAQPNPVDGRFFDRALSESERISLFTERATTGGSKVHQLSGIGTLAGKIRESVSAGELVLIESALPFSETLRQALGDDARTVAFDQCDEPTLFSARAVVTGVDFAIAETGSIAVSVPRRLASNVPELHFALIRPRQIVPDLLDLPEAFGNAYGQNLTGGFTIISGPSKTADIEMNLVIGVHGPAQMHMVIGEF